MWNASDVPRLALPWDAVGGALVLDGARGRCDAFELQTRAPQGGCRLSMESRRALRRGQGLVFLSDRLAEAMQPVDTYARHGVHEEAHEARGIGAGGGTRLR